MTREELAAKLFVGYVVASDIADSFDRDHGKFNYEENAEHSFEAADAFIKYAAKQREWQTSSIFHVQRPRDPAGG